MDPIVLSSPNGRNQATLYYGQDVRESLKGIPDGSIHMACTSPPYWNLRDYGTGKWEGGDINCDHVVGGQVPDSKAPGAIQAGVRPGCDAWVCRKCGAQRIDSQIGLEDTPEAYIQNLVEVFREVGRVLRDDGTLWLNIGDSYFGGGSTTVYGQDTRNFLDRSNIAGTYTDGMCTRPVKPRRHVSLKHKDLVGIPWMLAFALREDGWFLRQDILWVKPNPLPESVTDRCTKDHEYIFLLTKRPSYFYDAHAIKEPLQTKPHAMGNTSRPESGMGGANNVGDPDKVIGLDGMRNRRSTWVVPTKPYAEAHFATWPEDLVETMIKAGTSEKGCCAKCGAPWERLTSREAEQPQVDPSELDRFGTGDAGVHRKIGGQYQEWLEANPVRTTGWKPTCDCQDPNTVPCTVLDPFSGSATTGQVAWRMGRNYLGTDLNTDYLPLAQGRLIGVPSKVFQEAPDHPWEGIW